MHIPVPKFITGKGDLQHFNNAVENLCRLTQFYETCKALYLFANARFEVQTSGGQLVWAIVTLRQATGKETIESFKNNVESIF